MTIWCGVGCWLAEPVWKTGALERGPQVQFLSTPLRNGDRVWLIVSVLKADVASKPPWVQIPPVPLFEI